MVIAGCWEYYDLLAFSTRKDKKIYNRMIWSYHILRTFHYYSTTTYIPSITYSFILGEFPLETTWYTFILVIFQEKAGEIYYSYIESI